MALGVSPFFPSTTLVMSNVSGFMCQCDKFMVVLCLHKHFMYETVYVFGNDMVNLAWRCILQRVATCVHMLHLGVLVETPVVCTHEYVIDMIPSRVSQSFENCMHRTQTHADVLLPMLSVAELLWMTAEQAPWSEEVLQGNLQSFSTYTVVACSLSWACKKSKQILHCRFHLNILGIVWCVCSSMRDFTSSTA